MVPVPPCVQNLATAIGPSDEMTRVLSTTLQDNRAEQVAMKNRLLQEAGRRKTAQQSVDDFGIGMDQTRVVVANPDNVRCEPFETATTALRDTNSTASRVLAQNDPFAVACQSRSFSKAAIAGKVAEQTLQAFGTDPATIPPKRLAAKDLIPPIPPVITSAQGGLDTGIPVAWTSSSANRAASIVRIKTGAETTFRDAVVTADQSCTIPPELCDNFTNSVVQVVDVNKDGIESTPVTSPVISGDPTPPANVTGLVVYPANNGFSAYWELSASPDVVTYEIWYDTVPGLPNPTIVDVNDVTDHTQSGLVNGTPYYLKVVTVDRDGNLSSGALATVTPTAVAFNFSCVKIPAPPPPPPPPVLPASWVTITATAVRPIALAEDQVAMGDGIMTQFTYTMIATSMALTPGTMSFTAGALTATDDGSGGITGQFTGSIDYASGALSLVFAAPLDVNVPVIATYDGPTARPSGSVSFSNMANTPVPFLYFNRLNATTFTYSMIVDVFLGTMTVYAQGRGENGDFGSASGVIDLTLVT